jgi:hypothetical protein
MSLLSTFTALTKPVLALVLLSSSLLVNPALANDPTVKNKQVSTKQVAPASTAVAAKATLTLTGRIRNEEGQPLAGATVYLQGSDQAVSTDEQGIFSIEVPTAGKKTLRYGYGGYQDRDVVVEASAPLTMSLHPSPETLEQRKQKD